MWPSEGCSSSPAASAILDDDTHDALRQRLNAAWRPIVYLVIALFLGALRQTTVRGAE